MLFVQWKIPQGRQRLFYAAIYEERRPRVRLAGTHSGRKVNKI